MWCVSLEIPNACNMGLEIMAAVEPVMANTKIMTKTCQFEVMFQRSLKFPMITKVVQIYSN
jgi:hypothetical protein